MDVSPIVTEDDYRAALRLVSRLVDLDPDPSTPDGELLDTMATLVQAYEAEHYPIDPIVNQPGAGQPDKAVAT